MSRGVEEGYLAAVGKRNVIRSDVLRDASCLTGNHVGVAYVVEERCLTVVYVSHHCYDRSARHEIVLVVLLLGYGFRNFRTYILCLETELVGNKVDGLGIESLVDRNHDAYTHTCTDYLVYRYVHHARKLAHGYKLRKLQRLALCLCLGALLLQMLLSGLALLLAVLGSLLVLALAGESCQSFLYLTCNVFLVNLERLVVALAVLLLGVALVCVAVATAVVVLLNGLVYVYALLCYARTFLLSVGMSLHGLLLALLAALLLGLLLRTGALVERVEVNFSEHVHLRCELLLALQCEDFALFLYGFRLCRFSGAAGCCACGSAALARVLLRAEPFQAQSSSLRQQL